jgi:hypothetical protein
MKNAADSVLDAERPRSRATRRQPSPIAAQSCVGVVVAGAANALRVVAGEFEAPARCAASCLLVPQAGDTVACFQVAPAEIWILAVLEREAGATQVLRCQGPTRFEVEGGALEMHAQEISLSSQRFSLDSARAEVNSDDFEFVGRQVRVVAGAMRLIGSALSTVFDRVVHFSKHHSRTTEGLDRVHAAHVELEAQQLARIAGEHVLVNGDKLVKARGGQIHFG